MPTFYICKFTKKIDISKNAVTYFDEGNLIVLINSFEKKASKKPKQEIELAKN
jgi:hypothetical protein